MKITCLCSREGRSGYSQILFLKNHGRRRCEHEVWGGTSEPYAQKNPAGRKRYFDTELKTRFFAQNNGKMIFVSTFSVK
ncbi:MAG TPA: hypothetical protein DDW94_07235 [Deltaproteobacteria bacterium]|nr:MAG: hypothetical protein A3I81_08580 [Deltaproteobacteria bacterium RIFCSPLOWO2_02_FULL_55_12]HBG46768.1 hypothetical protein [Deltaproteobacteria bacterium]HCY11223.1 hypothetical protein [Deltaproteobacteria bacterium]